MHTNLKPSQDEEKNPEEPPENLAEIDPALVTPNKDTKKADLAKATEDTDKDKQSVSSKSGQVGGHNNSLTKIQKIDSLWSLA